MSQPTSKSRPQLLMHEQFVAVFPSLVRALDGSVIEAAVLQAIHYRLQPITPDVHGVRWLNISRSDVADMLGVSMDQVKRALAKLRDRGLVVDRRDRSGVSKEWSIDYIALDDLAEGRAESPDLAGRAESPESRAESPGGSGEIARTTSYIEIEEVEEVSSALAETVILAEIVQQPTARDVAAAYVDEYRDMHGNQPPTQSVKRIARDAKTAIEECNPVDAVVEAARQAARAGHANLSSALTRVLAVNAQSPFQKRSGASMFLEVAERLSVDSLFDMKEIGE